MKKLLYIILLIAVCAGSASAQRKITPVKTPGTVPVKAEPKDSVNKANVVQYQDESGKTVMVDTVTGKEVVDSIGLPNGGKVPKMIYPLLHSASVAVDIWDPLMRIMGNHFGMIGFSAQVSLHNRYIPTFEFGLSNADYTPEDGNFTYKSSVAPYFKIGCDYNIFYNSNPDYYIYAGLRYGFSFFSYQLTNVTIENEYWGINEVVDMPKRDYNAQWLELCLGLKVKIYGPISMGWSVRYHSIMSQSSTRFGKPYCIPGFGTHSSSIGGSFSIYYTLDLNKKKKEPADPVAEK